MNLKIFVDKLFVNNQDLEIKSNDATKYLFTGFRLLGIHFTEKNRTGYIIYSAIVNLLVCVYLPIAFTISLIIYDMDTGKFLSCLQAALNVYGCVLKFVFMGFLLPKLRSSKEIIDKLDKRCINANEHEKVRYIIKAGNRVVLFFAFVYYSHTTSAVMNSFLTGAPLYALYIPYVDWRRSKADVLITILTEYVLINIAGSQEVVDDAYPVIYMGILRTHLQLLLARIENLCTDTEKTDKENTKELIECVTDHKNILELFNIIHPVISTTIFIQFMITAVISSVTLINIMVSATLSSSIASLLYIFAIAFEIFPCCYYANSLMEDSDRIASTIFHSSWTEQSIGYKKILLFFMHRSQKTIELNAGKLFPITLNSFLGIAKFTFSLYTLLNGMNYGMQ